MALRKGGVMDINQLRELKDGDKVIFFGAEKEIYFTVDKEYVVKKTGTGAMVYNDNGMGKFLNDMKDCFTKL
jgi:hypothetical protein